MRVMLCLRQKRVIISMVASENAWPVGLEVLLISRMRGSPPSATASSYVAFRDASVDTLSDGKSPGLLSVSVGKKVSYP